MKFKMLVLLCLCTLTSKAADITNGTLEYNVISLQDMTVGVVSCNENKYCADIKVPESITHNGRTLTVVSILHSAFKGNQLRSIELPKTITRIEASAFSDCTNLTEIAIPPRVEYIGDDAFVGSGLQSFTNDNEECVFGAGVFRATPLKSAHITGESTGSQCFSRCAQLTEAIVDVAEPGNNFFYGCSSLTEVKLSHRVKNLKTSFFRYCSSLPSLVIPANIERIDSWSFVGCNALTNLSFEDCAETIELGCYNTNPDENFYNTIYGLFKDCPIETLYLGRHFKRISNTKLETSGYPKMQPFNEVTTITNLTFGKIPYDMRDLSTGEFINLKQITCLGQTYMIGEFPNKVYMDAIVEVPAQYLSKYQANDVWSKFWNLGAAGIGQTVLEHTTVSINGKTYILPSSVKYHLFDIQGTEYKPTPKGDYTDLTPGIYILKSENQSQKLVIR